MRRGLAGAVAAAFILVVVPAQGSPAPQGAAAVQPNTPSTGSHLLLDFDGTAFRQKSVPTAFGIAFAKGFTLDASAAPGICSAKQAEDEQCPDDSRLGAGAVGVLVYGPIFPPAGQRLQAKVDFFRTDPPSPGDLGGVVIHLVEPTSNYSGSAIGPLRTIDNGDFGTEIRWDRIPLPPLPSGITATLDHLQIDLGVGSATAPVKVTKPKKKPAAKKKKVALPCIRYKGRKHHRTCAAYRHRKPSAKAHKSAATSFIVNPAECPAAGNWPIQLQVGYADGNETREATAPCVAGAR